MATFKQQQAAQNLIENRGMPIGEAMVKAGYDPTSAKNPKNLTNSKGFRELLDKIIPQDKVADELNNLLYASHLDHYVFPLSMSDEEITELVESIKGCKVRKIKHGETQTWAYFWTPDNKSKKDAIDMLLKVRGSYAAEKIKIEDTYEGLSDEEIEEKIAELQAKKAQNTDNPEKTTSLEAI